MIRYVVICPGATAEQLEKAGAAARATAERLGVDPLDAAEGFAAHERWDRAGCSEDTEPTETDRKMMDAYFEIVDSARASVRADGVPESAAHRMELDLIFGQGA